MKVIVMHHVWPEVLASAEWYQMEEMGVGARFVERISEALTKIGKAPFLYPVLYRDARRMEIRGFPYGVFYVVRGDAIYVFSLHHLKRNPRLWKRRIPAD